jgi:PIN domain nuclease of toxin-antitoxin system
LLDTHFAVWLALEPEILTVGERDLIADADSLLYVSAVSLWELRIKWNRKFKSGDRKGPGDPQDIWGTLALLGVEALPLTPQHACVSLNAPTENKDPFDEQLLVHAQELGMQLLTRDAMLINHPLAFTAP